MPDERGGNQADRAVCAFSRARLDRATPRVVCGSVRLRSRSLNLRQTLSVLVPIYNERATIERLLNEVISVDTGLNLEVLACDDGSTDGTRDILSKLSLPGVKVIFMDENVGRGGV